MRPDSGERSPVPSRQERGANSTFHRSVLWQCRDICQHVTRDCFAKGTQVGHLDTGMGVKDLVYHFIRGCDRLGPDIGRAVSIAPVEKTTVESVTGRTSRLEHRAGFEVHVFRHVDLPTRHECGDPGHFGIVDHVGGKAMWRCAQQRSDRGLIHANRPGDGFETGEVAALAIDACRALEIPATAFLAALGASPFLFASGGVGRVRALGLVAIQSFHPVVVNPSACAQYPGVRGIGWFAMHKGCSLVVMGVAVIFVSVSHGQAGQTDGQTRQRSKLYSSS